MKRIVLPLLALLAASPALADITTLIDPSNNFVGTSTNPLVSSDPNNVAFSAATPFVVGGPPVPVGRSVAVNCTVAGNVTFTMSNGGSYTVQVPVGWSLFRFAVTGASAATATATYANLN